MIKKILFAAVPVMILSLITVLPVMAYTNENCQTVTQNEDTLWNYDFNSADRVGQYDHVDQPVCVVFGGNADKTSVKDAYYYDGFQYIGSTMWNELDDGAGWVSDSDGGRKTDGSDLDGYHFRLYAAGGSNMNNSSWDDYVVATTHRDLLPTYGYNEECEYQLCYLAYYKSGWSVTQDTLYFRNRDWPGNWDLNNYFRCDGWASLITLP
ncbi:MAG: hypothetical protein DRI01_03790 [Chloroflexi bacterium]|nr:MAG: hypothetical protein DRI01_03790 [Chloroflexota bacterium]